MFFYAPCNAGVSFILLVIILNRLKSTFRLEAGKYVEQEQQSKIGLRFCIASGWLLNFGFFLLMIILNPLPLNAPVCVCVIGAIFPASVVGYLTMPDIFLVILFKVPF